MNMLVVLLAMICCDSPRSVIEATSFDAPGPSALLYWLPLRRLAGRRARTSPMRPSFSPVLGGHVGGRRCLGPGVFLGSLCRLLCSFLASSWRSKVLVQCVPSRSEYISNVCSYRRYPGHAGEVKAMMAELAMEPASLCTGAVCSFFWGV